MAGTCGQGAHLEHHQAGQQGHHQQQHRQDGVCQETYGDNELVQKRSKVQRNIYMM